MVEEPLIVDDRARDEERALLVDSSKLYMGEMELCLEIIGLYVGDVEL